MSTELVRAGKEPAQRPVAIGLAAVAGVLTIIWRLIPHPANCLPLGAMGIHGGAKLRGWKPFLFPLAVLVISDIALWVRTDFDMQYLFHLSRIYVYGSFLIYVLIGRMLRGRESVLAIGGASLLGSLQFFLVTNFCVWLFQPLEPLDRVYVVYSRDLSGLLTCFAAALPFFQGDSPLDLHALFVGDPRFGTFYLVAGDLVFTYGLFGLQALLARTPVAAGQPRHDHLEAAPALAAESYSSPTSNPTNTS